MRVPVPATATVAVKFGSLGGRLRRKLVGQLSLLVRPLVHERIARVVAAGGYLQQLEALAEGPLGSLAQATFFFHDTWWRLGPVAINCRSTKLSRQWRGTGEENSERQSKPVATLDDIHAQSATKIRAKCDTQMSSPWAAAARVYVSY